MLTISPEIVDEAIACIVVAEEDGDASEVLAWIEMLARFGVFVKKTDAGYIWQKH